MPSQPQPQQAHYYWVIPIILFIITQTSVAIWWASDLNTSIASLQTQVEVSIRDGEAEDLRQWGRIHTNGIEINNVEQDIDVDNSRFGLTFAYRVFKGHSLKAAYTDGFSTRAGTDFNTFLLAYQFLWFDKNKSSKK